METDFYTEQDLLNIETYQASDTEDLFFTVEALHCVKRENEDTLLIQQIDHTISIIRDILIERNAVN